MKTENSKIESELSNNETKIREPRLGEIIDGFNLKEQLYQSRKNTLYFVTHEDHHLKTVMKVPRINSTFSPTTFASFETELRILSRLHGIYTPRMIAKGNIVTCPYIVIKGDTDNLITLKKSKPRNYITESKVKACQYS